MRAPEVRLAIDNDVAFRIAENVVHLRRYRGLTQSRLAKAMKTSQAAVARIEGASENITLTTLEKAVRALRGRLSLAISPAERHVPHLPDWWAFPDAALSAEPFTCRFVVVKDKLVAAGWEGAANPNLSHETPIVVAKLSLVNQAPLQIPPAGDDEASPTVVA